MIQKREMLCLWISRFWVLLRAFHNDWFMQDLNGSSFSGPGTPECAISSWLGLAGLAIGGPMVEQGLSTAVCVCVCICLQTLCAIEAGETLTG